ncbi:MAG: Fructokinase [Clostridia bacterium]|jgi:fructokinase|nr:Fructokinase [Clostridia bacterium]
MFDIVAVGELLIDFTPMKNKQGLFFKENPGGAPCNMLTMAQKLGSKTAFIGKVGKDQFGIHLGNVLKEQNIDVTGLVFSEECPTTLAFVHLDEAGDRSFSFYRNGCADVMLEKSEVDYTLIDKTRALHFGSLSFTNEPSKTTVLDMLTYAKKKGKLISYDPNYRPALWASEAAAVEGMRIGLEYADIIKVSDEEAVLLTGEVDFYKAAEQLYKSGITLVCVTLGAKGSFYFHKNGQGIVEGYQSKAIDTTGAGDSFFGAVMHQILQRECEVNELPVKDLNDIFSFSNAAASICIENFGGIPSIPSREDILKRL